MDAQNWNITWDDEDIDDDFSEILRKEKQILRCRNVKGTMETTKSKYIYSNGTNSLKKLPKDISKEAKLSDLSRKNTETLENFNDFLYWREPLEIIDFDGLFPPTCKEPKIPEKVQHSAVNEKVDMDDSKFKDANKQEGVNRQIGKNKTNDKVPVGKKQTGKKKKTSRPTNSATSTLNSEQNPIKSIDIDTQMIESPSNNANGFSSKTLRNQHGTYPPWMSSRKIQRKSSKRKKKSADC